MIIKIFGKGKKAEKLFDITEQSLKELKLTSVIKLKKTSTSSYKKALGILKDPAFCIEEKSIDFKDIIFEGEVPSKKEIISLITSIISGEGDGGSCSSDCINCGMC